MPDKKKTRRTIAQTEGFTPLFAADPQAAFSEAAVTHFLEMESRYLMPILATNKKIVALNEKMLNAIQSEIDIKEIQKLLSEIDKLTAQLIDNVIKLQTLYARHLQFPIHEQFAIFENPQRQHEMPNNLKDSIALLKKHLNNTRDLIATTTKVKVSRILAENPEHQENAALVAAAAFNASKIAAEQALLAYANVGKVAGSSAWTTGMNAGLEAADAVMFKMYPHLKPN